MIKRQQLTREQTFLAKPVKNTCIRWKKDKKGEATLYIPRRKSKIMDILSGIFFIPKEKIVNLDERGTYIWELCDGNNTVQGIISKLEKKFKLNRREVEISSLEYLKKLTQKGIIGLAIINTNSKIKN